MTLTFTYMPKASDDTESVLSKENITGRADPRLKAFLDPFGKRMRQLGVHKHGQGGESNALEALIEMAYYMKWFEDPKKFAADLLRYRADDAAKRLEK